MPSCSVGATNPLKFPRLDPSGNARKAARRRIDEALEAAGWQVQNVTEVNLHAGRGVAVREFELNAEMATRLGSMSTAALLESSRRLRRETMAADGPKDFQVGLS